MAHLGEGFGGSGGGRAGRFPLILGKKKKTQTGEKPVGLAKRTPPSPRPLLAHGQLDPSLKRTSKFTRLTV